MKFSEVKIGYAFNPSNFIETVDIVKTPEFYVTEIHEGEIEEIKTNAISLADSYYFFPDDYVVNLITKCTNCKHYGYQEFLDGDITKTWCDKLKCDIAGWLRENPETFSCAHFEKKEGV